MACFQDSIHWRGPLTVDDTAEVQRWAPTINIVFEKYSDRSYADRTGKMHRTAIACHEETAVGDQRCEYSDVRLEYRRHLAFQFSLKVCKQIFFFRTNKHDRLHG